jgi:hypothetical protein
VRARRAERAAVGVPGAAGAGGQAQQQQLRQQHQAGPGHISLILSRQKTLVIEVADRANMGASVDRFQIFSRVRIREQILKKC